ncbi:hypothetical protein [Bosea sp. (in: a-proteobacteria)]|uniref:hypothetical protein n=1 Tax=Bosea sp. (in: a-proteobacteria) TaxID=1871050 RepID=UPI002FC9B152
MRRLLWCLAPALLAPAVLASMAAAADRRPSLCLREEEAVFSCAVGARIVSLCASADIGPGSGTLIYRFGREGALELTYPDPPRPPDAAFSAAVIGDAGSAGDIVRFSRGDATYALYSIIVKGQGERNGVLVTQAGRQAADLKCRDFPLGRDAWGLMYRAKLPRAVPADLDPR